MKILGTIALIDEGIFLDKSETDVLYAASSLVSSPFSLLRPPSLPLLCSHFSPSGETDWKVLVIDVADPLAPKMNGEGMKLGGGLRM